MSEQKIRKQDLKKIGQNLYEIPKGIRPFMRVPARLYADESLLEDALADRSIEQLVNTATLVIPLDGIRKFLEATGHASRLVDIEAAP